MARAAANSPMRPRWRGRCSREWPEQCQGQALCRLHRRRAVAATGQALIAALHDEGFEIGIETNGTLLPPPGIDWICVSPKAGRRTEAEARRRIEADLSAGGRRAGALCRPGLPAISSCSRWTIRPSAANTEARDRLLPGPSAMAAVAADPQIDRNSLSYAAMRPAWPRRADRHGMAAGMTISGLVLRGTVMNSWYLPAIPAAMALSFIAYSFLARLV